MWIVIIIYAIFIFKKKSTIYTSFKKNEIRAHTTDYK